MAYERNKLWQRRQDAGNKINELTQKASEQQSQIASLNSQLQALGGLPQLEAEFNRVQSAIATVNQRLQPLQRRPATMHVDPGFADLVKFDSMG